jgi:hypothetical protein
MDFISLYEYLIGIKVLPRRNTSIFSYIDICLLRHVYINSTKKTRRPRINLDINNGKRYLPVTLPISMAVLESRTASDDSELFVMPNICTTPVMVNYIMEAE